MWYINVTALLKALLLSRLLMVILRGKICLRPGFDLWRLSQFPFIIYKVYVLKPIACDNKFNFFFNKLKTLNRSTRVYQKLRWKILKSFLLSTMNTLFCGLRCGQGSRMMYLWQSKKWLLCMRVLHSNFLRIILCWTSLIRKMLLLSKDIETYIMNYAYL